jgi:hypothetical protein
MCHLCHRTLFPSVLAIVAAFSLGCGSTSDETPQPPLASDAASNDATADAAPPDQRLDDAGQCVSDAGGSFCPSTFQTAVQAGSTYSATKAGQCRGMLVWIGGEPNFSSGCAYDLTGSTLKAWTVSQDVLQYCSGTSRTISSPNWPGCQPIPIDAGAPDAGPADAAADTSTQADATIDAPVTTDSSVAPPADAIADTGTSGEWVDDAGVCRSSQIPAFRTCAATFQAAVDAGAPVGMVRSGWCGSMLVWISYATPSLGCAYDSTGATLVAKYFGDDVADHCGKKSYSVSTPNWPANCTPAPTDAGPG